MTCEFGTLVFTEFSGSRIYRKWQKREKYSVCKNIQKCLVDARHQRRRARQVQNDRKARGTQTRCAEDHSLMQNTSNVEADAAEDHTGCHCNQLKTGN